MKSGNTVEMQFNGQVNLKSFEGMHRDPKCKGEWQLTITTGPSVRFTIDVLGPVQLERVPLATCHTCHTSYELPNFRRPIEKTIAEHLVKSQESLSKRQIKFLRLFFRTNSRRVCRQNWRSRQGTRCLRLSLNSVIGVLDLIARCD